jgi:putrescine transport system substrate-binding protein
MSWFHIQENTMSSSSKIKTLLSTLIATTFALGLATFSSVAGAQEEEKILNIYNWSDYIAEDTLKNFEKETGIKVRYDTFDNNEILHAKLVAGKTGYDIVVPSSNWARLQIEGGLLRKLDKGLMSNYKNLDESTQKQIASLDPGNQYLVNWLWGFTTVGINVEKVKAALGNEPMPANIWELVFNPKYISKMKGCGVSFLDSASEVLPAALHYLGKDPFSKNPADYQAASEVLKSVRQYITLFSSSGYINDMASGSICLSLGWSGDINIAKQRAIDGKTGQNLQALIPSNGGLLFFDMMAIPADAAHPKNAHKFIDYILRPEVHASITNKVFYANPNAASRKFVKPDIANNPTVFPPAADMAKMIPPKAINNDIRRLMTRVYTGFKTGL